MQTCVYRQSYEVLELDTELSKYQYAANKIDQASSVLITHSPSAHRYTQYCMISVVGVCLCVLRALVHVCMMCVYCPSVCMHVSLCVCGCVICVCVHVRACVCACVDG